MESSGGVVAPPFMAVILKQWRQVGTALHPPQSSRDWFTQHSIVRDETFRQVGLIPTKGDMIMMSLRKTAIIALASVSVVSAGFAAPALAAPRSFDAARLDKAPAEYSQYYRGYRGGWRGGNRGAAIAAGVGLGILGAAAVASSRRAYAEPYYEDDGYGYGYAPVYAPAPVYEAAPVYRRPYYRPSYDFRDHR